MEEINNKSRLVLEKRHQLIDLNKEYVNFAITFECRSVDATKDFEIIVVNQEQLNTIDLSNLTMKKTKGGYISGNIIADEDKYQNYFLIMRSTTEEPVEVDLDIRIKPIEPKQQEIVPPPPSHPEMEIPPSSPLLEDSMMMSTTSTATNNTQLYLIVLGLLVIGGAIGYYFWKKNRGGGNDKDEDARSVYSDHSASSKASSALSEEQGLLNSLLHKTTKE